MHDHVRFAIEAGSVAIEGASEGGQAADATFGAVTLNSAAGDVRLDVSRLPRAAGAVAPYSVCTCAEGSLYLLSGSLACDNWAAEFAAIPCP